jgi:hypothetical protein
MAAAAEITYGVPVNVEFGDVFADLGVENRDGQRIVVMALDDGDSFMKVELTPERAELLSDVLRGLAHIGR